MSYSFTQIEKEKSHSISFAFLFLVLLYFFSTWVIALFLHNGIALTNLFLRAQEPLGLSLTERVDVDFRALSLFSVLIIFVCSLFIATVHWISVVEDLALRVVKIMKLKRIDKNDPYQAMFANIIEEISAATGGGRLDGMIIPSGGLNACSISDGQYVPVIAVTQGLLYRLTRAQLEAVVAHEAAHIVSGDCESVTTISAMFEFLEAFLKEVKDNLTAPWSQYKWNTSVSAESPDIGLIASPNGLIHESQEDSLEVRWWYGLFLFGPFFLLVGTVIGALSVINIISKTMRMFISRQREYRADAIAVRLTRDPLSLAESLHIIANRRRKTFTPADVFESMFIVNPRITALDEELGLAPDLFSTHPPIKERIRILLNIARRDQSELQEALKKSEEKAKDMPVDLRDDGTFNTLSGKYFIENGQKEWIGPYLMSEIMAKDGIGPDTIVKKFGSKDFILLGSRGIFDGIDPKKLKCLPSKMPRMACPACSSELSEFDYEGVKVLRCFSCQGILADENAVGMIFQRKIYAYNDRIKKLALAAKAEKTLGKGESLILGKSDRTYRCGKNENCPGAMRLQLFNRVYPVEVDKCSVCGLTWFDKDEIEILQCLYEMQ